MRQSPLFRVAGHARHAAVNGYRSKTVWLALHVRPPLSIAYAEPQNSGKKLELAGIDGRGGTFGQFYTCLQSVSSNVSYSAYGMSSFRVFRVNVRFVPSLFIIGRSGRSPVGYYQYAWKCLSPLSRYRRLLLAFFRRSSIFREPHSQRGGNPAGASKQERLSAVKIWNFHSNALCF